MFGNDHYPIKLGLNKNVPFRSYNENNENGVTYHDINVVAITSISNIYNILLFFIHTPISNR